MTKGRFIFSATNEAEKMNLLPPPNHFPDVGKMVTPPAKLPAPPPRGRRLPADPPAHSAHHSRAA
jgi:hypothetical protein